MLIGFTYDLYDDYIKSGFSEEEAAEFDVIETIESIEKAIISIGFEVERIGNIRNLVNLLAEGKKWDIVFNICEGVSGIGRESQVPCLLEAYNIPYIFSSPETMMITMDKSLAKHIVSKVGVQTPKFHVISPDTMRQDIQDIDLSYPMFAKPLAEGTSKGIDSLSKINNIEQLKVTCSKLISKFKQPVLIEEFLPGREFTVGIIGTGENSKVIGVTEITFKNGGDSCAYTYRNKVECLDEFSSPTGEIVDEVSQTALKVWKALKCRDGGRIDIRLSSQGTPNFIEANPLAGLRPDYSELVILAENNGISYVSLIKEIIYSAINYYGINSRL